MSKTVLLHIFYLKQKYIMHHVFKLFSSNEGRVGNTATLRRRLQTF